MADAKIEIRMNGVGAEEELRSLHTWLLEHPSARRHADIAFAASAPPAEGAMGGALDAIQMAITDGFSAAQLAMTYVTWRSTRRTPVVVTLEYGHRKVTLSAEDPETLKELVRAVVAEEE